MSWSTKDIPDQSGKLALITGATGGLGYETALALARAGADVVLTGRNADKGAAALARIRAEVPRAKVSYESLDLAALANVAAFAERFTSAHDHLDILVNNAGVMAPPQRELTADGLELQFATNYLSHFALTGLLLPLLVAAAAPRVVSLASVAARGGRIDFANLQSEHDYKPMVAYSQTKLACLMFGFELQRRSDADGWGIASMVAHPGVARTELIVNGMGDSSPAGLARRYLSMLFQPVPQGALPTLMAATDIHARPGGYYGPRGLFEIRGYPGEASIPAQSTDLEVARRLWQASEQLTGIRFPDRASVAA
ncbi:short-chain dehydrogenase [Devosia sp. Root413D1]|jgi:NAD(P)-dependent dehydrogenase (short-subunit alcohol dehydrogenase family)|uniref:SDR family oxidoreductase n=1 Tax=unclassified Devosia TaxID=196773 RepID=UPI0007006714|nr:SDR family oxidoreductase [Devosia sp. Root413D1]KQW74936.1 short-chain dehydrogenase [Devosia sp. Root413D1]